MSNGPSTVELLVRLVFSLGLIVGLLALAAKVARKNGGALKLPGFGKKASAIKVLDRQSLSKSASLAVVQVGDRTMVVGITEHGITMLADGPSVEEEADLDLTFPTEISATDDDLVELAGIDVGAAQFARTTTSAATPNTGTISHEAKRTLPRGTNRATKAARSSTRSPRMSFVEALREMTVRKV